ncbi:MAG: diguanylate cyclase [Actinomycetota bacterium]
MPVGDIGKPLGRGQYWAKRVLFASTGTSNATSWVVLAVALTGCWLLGHLLGGAGRVAPHWFYLPVIFAGVRFGPGAAFVTGVFAGVLAGPLMPLDVADGVPQTVPDWATRLAFFVLIGQVVAFLVARSHAELAEELRRLRLHEDLRRGLALDEFHLAYQPIVTLGTGEIVGAEALLRWTQPDGSSVCPSTFVPVAEDSGLIVPIGAWVLREACGQASAWSRSLPPERDFKISVNVSALQLADPDLPKHVQAALVESGLRPSVLTLEVTETALIVDIEQSVAALVALKAIGVGLAIDDFGTGQSSLAYAHRFPVDVIKVDQSFVARIETDTASAAITASVIGLAHGLGMQALAEGIETAGQLALLRSMGCDLGQGYYFDRPATPEALSERLALASVG